MWRKIVQCRCAVHNKTPHSPTERPPSDRVVSAQGTRKSFPQWRKGDSHGGSSKVLDTQREITSEADSPQVPCVQEI